MPLVIRIVPSFPGNDLLVARGLALETESVNHPFFSEPITELRLSPAEINEFPRTKQF